MVFMRKLRIAVFFLLAALSCARAQCPDFEIFINSVSKGCKDTVSHDATFENPSTLTFSILPATGDIVWKTENGHTILGVGSQYAPILIEEIDNIFTYIIERDGVSKIIKLDFKARRYKVSFDSKGGSDVEQQSVIHNEKAIRPPNPTRTGYTFKDWKFDFNTPITGDIEIEADWEINKYTVSFTNKYDASYSFKRENVEHGSTTTPPDASDNPMREGYDFDSWDFDFATQITKNTAIEATWKPKTYTINFDPDGGTVAELSKQVTFNSAVGILPNATKEGYVFKGWQGYTASTIYTTAGDITLKATWEKQKFIVSFKTNGGSTVPSKTVEYYENVTRPESDPTLTGHTFKYWDFDFNTPITANTEIEARWEINKYTVSFTNKYDPSYTFKQEVEYNNPATPPSASDPVREGYDFDGWDFDFSRKITQNTTIEAKWKAKTYIITFDPEPGKFNRPADASIRATYNEDIGALPEPTRGEAYDFDGWFTEAGDKINPSNRYLYTTNITLYAHWKFKPGSKPTKEMLQLVMPSLPLVYNGRQIDPIEITQKADVEGELGEIIPLYNGESQRPKDVGIYRISANIKKSADYDSALVEDIGTLTINKRPVTLIIKQASVIDKDYDAQKNAEIDYASLVFETGSCEANAVLCGSDIVSKDDYTIDANFTQQDAGEDITVEINIRWLPHKNYNFSTPTYNTTANIKQAKSILKINVPESYELSSQQDLRDIIEVSPFIDAQKDIIWKYKWEKAAEFSDTRPNRVGIWEVWAYIESTNNYTGAEDIGEFLVERGSATTVIHDINFDEETPFKEDSELSTPQKKYYVTDDWQPSDCKIDLVKIKIEVKEPDIVLKIKEVGESEGKPKPNPGEEDRGIMYHEFSYSLQKLKPGLDTIRYYFYSRDGRYEEENIILIERPIHFDSVTVQKWNNLFLINNNAQKNGGYNFTGYKWSKNRELPLPKDTLQFYSAGPNRTDTLITSDKYSVQMDYAKGEEKFRISTCEGSPKQSKANPATPNSAVKKQALGINGKSAKLGAKIYNSKGERSNGNAPGIYLIEED